LLNTVKSKLRKHLYLYLYNFTGTKEERGILAWNNPVINAAKNDYLESADLYVPLMPDEMRKSKWLKFVPFLPEPIPDFEQCEQKEHVRTNGEIDMEVL